MLAHYFNNFIEALKYKRHSAPSHNVDMGTVQEPSLYLCPEPGFEPLDLLVIIDLNLIPTLKASQPPRPNLLPLVFY